MKIDQIIKLIRNTETITVIRKIDQYKKHNQYWYYLDCNLNTDIEVDDIKIAKHGNYTLSESNFRIVYSFFYKRGFRKI